MGVMVIKGVKAWSAFAKRTLFPMQGAKLRKRAARNADGPSELLCYLTVAVAAENSEVTAS